MPVTGVLLFVALVIGFLVGALLVGMVLDLFVGWFIRLGGDQ